MSVAGVHFNAAVHERLRGGTLPLAAGHFLGLLFRQGLRRATISTACSSVRPSIVFTRSEISITDRSSKLRIPLLDQFFGQLGVDPLDLRERLDRLLDHLVELLGGHDLDVPADELGGQPDILAAAADGQRELILADQDDRPAQQLAEHDLVDLGRLQGVGNQDLERLVPADDVDPLAAELVDDVLDPGAADAHARPDGVDLGVDRGDRHLRPIARLARQGPDRDDLVGDLGDLQLEEPADEVGMGAAEDDLDPLADLADVEDDRADPLVGVVALAGDLLAAGEDARRSCPG